MRKIKAILAGAVLVLSGLAVASQPATAGAPVYRAAKGMPSKSAPLTSKSGVNTFFYAAADQTPTAATDTVYMNGLVANPTLSGANHSLGEVAVHLNGTNPGGFGQTVELGWTVDPGVCGSGATPCLFGFWWKNGVPQCYNAGCGWVPYAPSTYTLGQSISGAVGSLKQFAIQHTGNAWWLSYDNVWMGYYPDSLWTGTTMGGAGATPAVTFQNIGYYQVFGEVAYNGATTQPASTACGDMGNGALGSSTSPLPARWSAVNMLQSGTTVPATLTSMGNANPTYWYGYAITAQTWRYGGPGAC